MDFYAVFKVLGGKTEELGEGWSHSAGENGYSEPNFTLVEKIARLCDFEMLVLDKSSDEMIRITDKKQ